MNTHVTSLERTHEAVRDNEVPFKVTKEDLHKINVFISSYQHVDYVKGRQEV